jgi:hypothetical protein
MKFSNSARAAAACAFLSMLSAGAVFAQTKYPYIDAVYPPVVTRGAATTVEVSASGNLKTAYLALVSGEGVRAEVLPRSEEKKLPDGSAAVKLEVAPGAAVGPRDLRLATGEALTTVATIYVTDLPAVLEGPKHSGPAEAQEITIPCAVNGRIGGSVEVDWYRFSAKKGERVNFNLLGARLHETIQHVGRFTPHFDAFLFVTDASGRELASNDDHYFADPLLSFEAPADGSYCVAVREANYKGHASYTYGLAATRGPCVANTLPLALAPGPRTAVELVGPGFGPSDRAEVELPAGAAPGRDYTVRPLLAGASVQEVEVAASLLPPVREAEAPGEAGNDPPAGAQEVPLPAGIAGRIGRPDDVDCFAFSAVKGTAYRFEVIARRLASPLDSDLVVLDGKGSVLASADDSRDPAGRTVKDSLLLWTAPADGRYLVRIRDLHQRGGPDFVYHLECAAAEPDFELTLDPSLTMIGPGNRSPVYLRAKRKGGFDGPISLEFEGLPAGVEAQAAPILPGMNDACVVLTARADAERGASIYRVLGRAAVKGGAGGETPLVREAQPLVEIYQAQRVLGRTPAVAVTAPSDIEVTTEVRELVLKPGESKEIPVRLVRGEKYKSGPVTLWAMWRFEGSIFGNSLPPGVTVNEKASSTSLNGEAVEGKISLQAAPDAKPISRVQTVVIGLVPIEYSTFVPYSTPPILVTVTDKDGAVAAAK